MLIFSLTSSSKTTLKAYAFFLVYMLENFFNIKYLMVRLPLKKKKITLLKSPHVYKKAKEHFEIHYFKTIFLIKMSDIHIRFIKYLVLNKPKSLNLKLIFLEK
jgi:ribosomal protein S10